GALDHGHQGREIVELEAAFAHHVDEARREQRIVVAVAAHYHALVVGLLRERHELVTLVVGEVLRSGRGERGVGEFTARTGPDRQAVERGRLAGDAEPTLAKDRLVDQAEHREAVNDQRDERSESRPPREEGASAVDRIEHPLPTRAAGYPAELF